MKLYFLSAMMALGCAAAAAETWTFADCVDYARAHNISLQKSLLAEQSADADLEEAEAQWHPSLDFATSQGFANSPWAEGAKNAYTSSYGLNASWTVWNGNRRENSISRSRLLTEIDRLNSAALLRSLETDLLQVYLNILYSREAIGIYEEAVKVSEAQAARARALMEAGKLSKVDFAQLDAQYEQDKYALVNARATYDTRRMELKQLLELGIDDEVEPAALEWTDTEVLAPLPELAESYSLALQTDLQLRGLQTQKEVSALDVDIARAGRMPNIALTAGVGTGYSAPGSSFVDGIKRGLSESVGLTLSIPILDNKKTKTAVARAKVAELEAQLDVDKRHTELAQLVETRFIDTRSAQARFSAAQSQLEAARLTDELTNERFALGLVNPVELMSAHNSYIEAQYTLLQAKYMAMLGRKMIHFYRTASVSLP